MPGSVLQGEYAIDTLSSSLHPRTRPTIEMLERAEAAFDFESMCRRAADNTRIVKL